MRLIPFCGVALAPALFALSGALPCSASGAGDFASRLEYVGPAVVEPDYYVWGSSPVLAPDGKTNLFVARWPRKAGFNGWATDCEIARYVGEAPEGPFAFVETVVASDGKTQLSPHNPTIHKVGDRYALFYIANAGRKGFPANQRIYLQTADSLDGPWRKQGRDGLILDVPDDPAVWSRASKVGVNNPALLEHPDGRLFLYYKAMTNGPRKMGVAVAERLEGPYVFHPEPLTRNKRTIEDGYAFVEDGKICLLTTDNDGNIEKGGGLLWTSDDGIHFGDPEQGFKPFAAYVDFGLDKPVARGRIPKFERPQALVVDGRPKYLYVASATSVTGGSLSCSYVLRVGKAAE